MWGKGGCNETAKGIVHDFSTVLAFFISSNRGSRRF